MTELTSTDIDGLLLVLSEPGRVPVEEFHAWYDECHGPARLKVPGIHGGERYRALDGRRPTWLAVYPLRLAALASPEYQRLRRRSAYERDLVARLDILDRRVYQCTQRVGNADLVPAPVLLTVALSSTDPDEVDAWYTEEHLPRLLAVPGWNRVTRYRRIEGAGPDLLAVHELSDTEVFATDGYRHAVRTPWRDAVMATVTARERRAFGHHRTLGQR